MQLVKEYNNRVTFDLAWSVECVEQSYNTEVNHPIIKITLSKLDTKKVIRFRANKIALLDFPIDPFGITEISIIFKRGTNSGEIYLECEDSLESAIINCSDIEIN